MLAFVHAIVLIVVVDTQVVPLLIDTIAKIAQKDTVEIQA